MKLHWATVLWSTQVTVAATLGLGCLVIQVSHVLNICIHEPKSHHILIHQLAPNRPTNLEITRLDSSSIQVTWSPPDMSNCADIDGYRITCRDDFCHRSYNLMEETPSHSSNVTFYDPYDNDNFDSCFFYCFVSGNNSAGEGPSSYVEGREYYLFFVRTSVYCYWMYSYPHSSKKCDSPAITNVSAGWVDRARTSLWTVRRSIR